MNANKVIETVEKMSETTVDGYKRIEDGVVEGYKKIEGTVVGTFNKISDKFIGSFLAKEGESVEEAKRMFEQSIENYEEWIRRR